MPSLAFDFAWEDAGADHVLGLPRPVSVPPPGVPCPKELRAMAARITAMAQAIEGRDRPEPVALAIAEPPPARADREQLRQFAASLYQSRRKREKVFSGNLFREPAWDMLLDLFISYMNGQNIGTTSLCIASNVPATTALRYISNLEQEGLIEKRNGGKDNRVTFVNLTDEGIEKMEKYLSDNYFIFNLK